MQSNDTPSPHHDPYDHASLPKRRKGLGPLAWILILSGSIFVLFLFVSGVVFISKSGSSTAKGTGSKIFSSQEIGVIELNGVIMDGRAKKFMEQLEDFSEDHSIKGVVVRLNSPGGSVAPSQEIYEAVKKFKEKKPLYVSMGSVAASGAYYVAMGAQKVYANAGTITGSIGVIMEFVNLEKLYEWAKVKRFALKTGKFKDAGSDHREMTSEERALLQGMIDNVLGQFRAAVMDGRKMTAPEVLAISDGRIFSGEQAKAAKLVDELGTLDDAIAALGAQLGIKGKPEVVYPHRRHKFWEAVLEGGDDDEESRSHIGGLASILREFLGIAPAASAMEEALQPGIYWLWKR